MPKGIPRNQSTNHKVLHRLKIARGHLDKVISMVEADDYCIDVVNQSRAVQNALKQVDAVLLKHHLHHCTVNAIQEGKGEEVINELITVFQKQS